jgi:hypothetical protein
MPCLFLAELDHASAQTPLSLYPTAPTQPVASLPAQIGGSIYHLVQPTYGCQDPRATRALTDTATARLNDPDWLQFFVSEGKCTRISTKTSWDELSGSGDMVLLQEHGRPGSIPLFFRSDLLSAAQDTVPPSTASVDASTPGPDPVLSANVPPAGTTQDTAPDAASYTATPSDAFTQGQADRKAWDSWVSGLRGDYRAGAEDWARQWGSPGAGSCETPGASQGGTSVGGTSQDWRDGCFAARLRSVASDMRRQTEPFYAQGWNAPFGSAPPGSEPVAAGPSAKDLAERKTASFKAGQADRKKWDTWFSGFLGDYRTGAAYWFAQRDTPSRGTCANAIMTQTWRDGCEMAKRKLADYAAHIQNDPLYTKGWNAADAERAPPKQASNVSQN